MNRNARRVAVVGVIALAATLGGFALGDFVMDPGSAPARAVNGAQELAEELSTDSGASNAVTTVAQRDLAPVGGYNCVGCDAGRAQDVQMADEFVPYEMRPLPLDDPDSLPHRSVDLPPAIAADQSAPDVVRRRAKEAASTGRSSSVALPSVIEADRRPAAVESAEP